MRADLPELEWIGRGLNRPECVLAHRSGWTFAATWEGRGGVSAIAPDGRVINHLACADGPAIRPNGIALEADGSFLIAHLGEEDGGVHRLHPDGSLEPVLTEVGGRPIPPSNFPVVDNLGRLWLSVSTTRVPRSLDYNPDARSGMLVLMDERGARVVADDLGYANEFIVSDDGLRLFVNETFRRRLVRYDIANDGSLKKPQVIAAFGAGTFPDGLAMDSEGGLWVTSIVSNRVIRIAPDGGNSLFLEDCDLEHLAWVEEAFHAGRMGRPHLDGIRSRALRNISSLAFGGPDLRTGYLGCLLGDSIATLRLPVAGMPLPHFDRNIDALIGELAKS
jgi:hypothetical protein